MKYFHPVALLRNLCYLYQKTNSPIVLKITENQPYKTQFPKRKIEHKFDRFRSTGFSL